MSVAHAALLFLVQIAFGSMLTFLVNDRDALGPKYWKVSGWIMVGLYGLAGWLCWGAGLDPDAAAWQRQLALSVAVAAVGMLGFSSVAGWDRPGLERLLLVVSLLAGGAAIVLSAHHFVPGAVDTTRAEHGLAVASAVASSLVLGFTTWAMILGHWYLVAPGLEIRHLAKLVDPLPWIFVLQIVVSGAALYSMWDHVLGPGAASLDDVLERSPDRVVDVLLVWVRIPLGLVIPAVLALMTRVTVKMEKTQPATGILYAMCVLVYMGDLMGKLVEGSTAVPL